MPTISVIVPVYKVEPYLRRCVDSILDQTYSDFELILVDDGSPDNCPDICDDYARQDSRVKVIHKENGGLSDARNAGLRIAAGAYVSFVDSDDFIRKDMYEVMLAELICADADFIKSEKKKDKAAAIIFDSAVESKPKAKRTRAKAKKAEVEAEAEVKAEAEAE